METDEQKQEIIFIINDGSQHKYLYKDNNIYFIIKEDPAAYDSKAIKYITLCESIDSCIFSYENKKLTTELQIGDIKYRNNFAI